MFCDIYSRRHPIRACYIAPYRINHAYAYGTIKKNIWSVPRAAFAGRSFMKVWRPGPDAFPKPAQYLDARVEMRERVLKVITSIAEHMSKIE